MKAKRLLGGLLFAAAAAVGLPSQSATLFSDDFDTDNAASVLNFTGLLNWTVSDGTIDYIRNGGFGISCFGGAGGCLDMDGSTSNAGRIVSTSTFTLSPGVLYTLAAQVSGNQRGGAADSLIFGLLDASGSVVQGSETFSSIASSDPFSPRSFSYATGVGIDVRLFIEGVGGDNLGAILDNVVFSDDVNVVPVPAALPLFGSALVGLGVFARRRKQPVV